MAKTSYDIPLSLLKENKILTKNNFYSQGEIEFSVEISLIKLKIYILKIRFVATNLHDQSISANVMGEVSFKAAFINSKKKIELDESAPSDSLYLQIIEFAKAKDCCLHITFGIDSVQTKNNVLYSPTTPVRDTSKRSSDLYDKHDQAPDVRPANDVDKVNDSYKTKEKNKIKDCIDTNPKDKIGKKDDKDKKIDDPSPFHSKASNKNFISTVDSDSDSDVYEKQVRKDSDNSDIVNQKFNGLYNQGATCYINSAIQSLFHIPLFRKTIFDIPTANEKDQQHSVPLNLQCLFYNLQNGKSTCTTKMLTTSFGWEKNEVFHQQDIEEFFKMLLTKLDDIMKKIPEMKDKIGYIFEGKTIQLIKDKSSKLLSENKEVFLNLSVDVKRTLEDSLKKLTKEETIFDYVTDASKIPQQVTYETRLYNLPKVLFIHIKRYKFNPATGNAEKIDSEMKYSEDLDLKPFMYEESPKQCTKYKLFGVIVHSGIASAGHYYIYCKPELKNDWYEFNDASVRSVSSKSAIESNFGGYEDYLSSSYSWKKEYSAFMLVYIRADSIDEVFQSIDVSKIPPNIIEYANDVNKKELKRTKSDPVCQISFNIYNEKCVWENCKKGITSFINNKYCINASVDKRSTAEDLYNEVSKQIKISIDCIRLFQISQNGQSFSKVIKPTDKLSLIHNQNLFAQIKDENEKLELDLDSRIYFMILYTPACGKPFIYIQMKKYKTPTGYDKIIDDAASLFSKSLKKKIPSENTSLYLIKNHNLKEQSYFLKCYEDNGTIMIFQVIDPKINIGLDVRSELKENLKIKRYFKNIRANDDSERSEVFRYLDYMENKLPKTADKYFELRNNTRKSKVFDYSDLTHCKGEIEFPKNVKKDELTQFIKLALSLDFNDKTSTMLLFGRDENLNVPKSKPFNSKSSYSSTIDLSEKLNNIYYFIAPKNSADDYRSETRVIQLSKDAFTVFKVICYYLPDEEVHPFAQFKMFNETLLGPQTRMFIVDENNHAGQIIKDGANDDLIKLNNKNKLRIENIPNDQINKQLVLVYKGYVDGYEIQFFEEPFYFGYDVDESVTSFKARVSKFLGIKKSFKVYNNSYSNYSSLQTFYRSSNVLKDKIKFENYYTNKVIVLIFENNDE